MQNWVVLVAKKRANNVQKFNFKIEGFCSRIVFSFNSLSQAELNKILITFITAMIHCFGIPFRVLKIVFSLFPSEALYTS